MGTLQELENEVEKFFPYFNGYDPERKLPEVGQVILTLDQLGFVKVKTYEEGSLDNLINGLVRWWPLPLTPNEKGHFQRMR